MGWERWAWRHSAVGQLLKSPPMPKRVQTYAGGRTHRLLWADRNAQWRMRCSCGWIDPRLHWTQRGAITSGNGHAISVRDDTLGGDPTLEAALNQATAAIQRSTSAINRGDPQAALEALADARVAYSTVTAAISDGRIRGREAAQLTRNVETLEANARGLAEIGG